MNRLLPTPALGCPDHPSFLALDPHPCPEVIYWAVDSKQLVIAQPERVCCPLVLTSQPRLTRIAGAGSVAKIVQARQDCIIWQAIEREFCLVHVTLVSLYSTTSHDWPETCNLQADLRLFARLSRPAVQGCFWHGARRFSMVTYVPAFSLLVSHGFQQLTCRLSTTL